MTEQTEEYFDDSFEDSFDEDSDSAEFVDYDDATDLRSRSDTAIAVPSSTTVDVPVVREIQLPPGFTGVSPSHASEHDDQSAFSRCANILVHFAYSLQVVISLLYTCINHHLMPHTSTVVRSYRA